MQQAIAARTPMHLWIVGILSLLWNSFGAFDYVMTRMRNTGYLESAMPGVDPNVTLEWIDAFPIWASFGWGLGVWAALAGSVLLLMRSRYALWAFAFSLVGMALSFSAQYFVNPPPGSMNAGAMKYMPLVIVAIGLAQAVYAWRQDKNGVLR